MTNIVDIASQIGINEEDIVLYGKDKAKILSKGNKKDSKLILVTATTPTPSGEGKTTISIGLADALKQLDKKVVLTLREPSLGPIFGMKGGATGGGLARVIPEEDINLHFTGDFHAITTANNLISSAIDNHIYNGNKLNIKKVLFKRCIDINDRSLRNIKTQHGNTGFNITAASEIMSIVCLANNIDDLRTRLSKIIIGINDKDEYIYLKRLNIVGTLLVVLKDAIKPNLVQTLEKTPAIIHGGPFANIAPGCNSVIATKTALSYADYVVTEAGFAADLGAEKFFDIKCRESNIKPDCVVITTTIKSLEHSGKENLKIHYENMKKFNTNVVVCLNKFDGDKEEETIKLENYCQKENIPFTACESFQKGSKGSIELAKLVLKELETKNEFKLLYDNDLTIKEKIEIISKEIYRANRVIYSDKSLNKIDIINKNKLSYLPICVSKTQYSLSDDKNNKENNYDITVTDIDIYNGAGFITVLLGDVVTMPGLPKKPNYENIDLINNKVVGIK